MEEKGFCRRRSTTSLLDQRLLLPFKTLTISRSRKWNSSYFIACFAYYFGLRRIYEAGHEVVSCGVSLYVHLITHWIVACFPAGSVA